MMNLLRRGVVDPRELIEEFDGKNVMEYASELGYWDLVVELQYWAVRRTNLSFTHFPPFITASDMGM